MVDDQLLEEKTVDSQTVFQGRFLKIMRDRVINYDGKEYVREYIHHSGAAMIIPLTDTGHVILERQFRYAMKQVFWEFPAGKTDHGEESLLTAQRELREETGYTAGKWTFLTKIHPVIGYSNEWIDIYLAQDLVPGKQQLDRGERLHVVQMTPQELMEKVRSGQVTDVKTQIACFWLEKILNKSWQP